MPSPSCGLEDWNSRWLPGAVPRGLVRLTCCGTIFSSALLSHLAHSPSLSGQQPVPRGWGRVGGGDTTLYVPLGRVIMQLRRWGPSGLYRGHRTQEAATSAGAQVVQVPGSWNNLTLLSADGT